jgi:hypothetical protein
VSVNDYAELSSDPLLVQLVRGPAFFRLVNVYASKLFEKSGVGESSERGVEAVGGPLFSVVNSLGATTILSDGEVIEMMRVVTKMQGRARNELRVASFTNYLQDKGIVMGLSGRYCLGPLMDNSLFLVMRRK